MCGVVRVILSLVLCVQTDKGVIKSCLSSTPCLRCGNKLPEMYLKICAEVRNVPKNLYWGLKSGSFTSGNLFYGV